LYKDQKYSEAIAALQEAARTEPPNSPEFQESALLIGQSYFQLGQAPKAIPWLEKAPSANEVNYMLGYAYLQANRPTESTPAFARLFGVPPASAAAHLLAGQMMIKKGYEDQAKDELDKALAIDSKLPELHFLLGEIAIYRGRLDEAIADLRKELDLNPNFSMAWYRLGDVYTRQEHWNDAVADLQRAIWLNPDYSGPFILLGKCYFKTGNYSNAEGILRKALQIDPRNAAALYLLGQTLMLSGKKDEGRAVLDKWKEVQQPPQ
ncbi:MAG: tetratricopeptide repeat protein, partial [Acidobacteriaceae bacterium]|nr:tetratricopeptide repeat protein [Acidobacteriaceae bacterium]